MKNIPFLKFQVILEGNYERKYFCIKRPNTHDDWKLKFELVCDDFMRFFQWKFQLGENMERLQFTFKFEHNHEK